MQPTGLGVGAAEHSIRTSPAVMTEPVATTPPPRPFSSARVTARSSAFGQVGHHRELATPPKSSVASRPSRSGDIARGELLRVTTTWSRGGLEHLEDAGGVLVGDDPHQSDGRGEGERLLEGGDQGAGPVGVVGGIHEHGRAPAHDLQTSGRAHGLAGRAQHREIERLGPTPEEGLGRGHCDRQVVGLMGAEEGQEEVGILRGQAANRDELATDSRFPGEHAESAAPP